jgi:penicillin-binding protein 1A
VTLTQAALLRRPAQAPSRYAPTRNVELASARVDVVLDNMVDAGFLTSAEASAAAGAALAASAPSGDETGFPYAVDWVAETLPDFVGSNEGDLVVETDDRCEPPARGADDAPPDARRRRQGPRRERRRRGGARHRGGIKALIGGRSYRSSPFRPGGEGAQATWLGLQALRLSHRAESGYTPDSVANDSPVSVDGWAPKNHNGTYRGAVTLRDSFAHSINTVAAKLADDVGRAG